MNVDEPASRAIAQRPIRLGLRSNLGQFALLVAVNALVGGMIGQERTVLPILATTAFGVTGFVSALTFPLFYASAGLSLGEIGILAAAYPGVWAVGQVATGGLSDRIGRKPLIVTGMLLQAGAIAVIAAGSSFEVWLAASASLGLGTAMVYPTLLATIADVADPAWRGSAIGVYRLRRDLGFAIGALLAGVIVLIRMRAAIAAVAALTAGSGLVVLIRMRETLVRT